MEKLINSIKRFALTIQNECGFDVRDEGLSMTIRFRGDVRNQANILRAYFANCILRDDIRYCLNSNVTSVFLILNED